MNTGHTAPDRGTSTIARTMGKARIFSESLPFIKEFRDTTVVIKYGGSAMVDEGLRSTFADDIAMLYYVGIDPVIVHGGGPHISKAMHQRGVEPQFVEGLRVTDAETIRVVQSTLAGEINPDIVRLINAHGSVATGINGLDGNLFVAQPKDERLGFVGEITEVNPGLIAGLQERDFVPVIAPLARGEDGQVYNVNADVAAGALAVALGAKKLIYLTDVEGLYGVFGNEDTLIARSTAAGIQALLDSGTVSAGMLPKLKASVEAIEAGVERIHILDGRVQHAVLLEVFTPEGIGTTITEKPFVV